MELAKDTTNKKLPANFPIDKFLERYTAWENANASEKAQIYAELRDMHQAVGINK